jgi:hypothetical protein
MSSSLNILRRDARDRRVKGRAGGLQVYWSANDLARIDNRVETLSEKALRSVSAIERKRPDVDLAALRRKFVDAGVVAKDAQPADLNFLCIISTPRVDLEGDSVNTSNVDAADFRRNPCVLESHNSSALPVASSTMPWLSGENLMAIAKFPPPGSSADSDRVAAAIRAGLVKGVSIGFIPLSWSFSKDPARPLGVNFEKIKLLEFSVCSLPCCPDALIIGPIASNKSLDTIVRVGEARALVSKARAGEKRSRSAPTTREQRLAEAREFRRRANATR